MQQLTLFSNKTARSLTIRPISDGKTAALQFGHALGPLDAGNRSGKRDGIVFPGHPEFHTAC